MLRVEKKTRRHSQRMLMNGNPPPLPPEPTDRLVIGFVVVTDTTLSIIIINVL